MSVAESAASRQWHRTAANRAEQGQGGLPVAGEVGRGFDQVSRERAANPHRATEGFVLYTYSMCLKPCSIGCTEMMHTICKQNQGNYTILIAQYNFVRTGSLTQFSGNIISSIMFYLFNKKYTLQSHLDCCSVFRH